MVAKNCIERHFYKLGRRASNPLSTSNLENPSKVKWVNSRVFGTRGNLSCKKSEMLSVNRVYSRQSKWQASFDPQPEKAELPFENTFLQDVQSSDSYEIAAQRCLDDLSGHQGRIFACSDSPKFPKILRFHSSRSALFFQSHAFWPNVSPLYIFKTHEASIETIQRERNHGSCVSGRFDNLGGQQNCSVECQNICSQHSNEIRFQDKLSEVKSSSYSESQLVGDELDYQSPGSRPDRRLQEKGAEPHSGDRIGPSHHKTIFRRNSGNALLLGTNSSFWQTKYESADKYDFQNSSGQKRSSSYSSLATGRCSSLVEGSRKFGSKNSYKSTRNRCILMDRCFKLWLRCQHRSRRISKRNLESRSKVTPHQRPRAFSGGNCPTIRSDTVKFHSRLISRQYSCLLLHQESRFKQVYNSSRNFRETLRNYKGQKPTSISFPSARSQECGGRCPVKRGTFSNRMGVTTGLVQGNSEQTALLVGGGRNGDSSQQETPGIHLSFPSSSGSRSRFFPHQPQSMEVSVFVPSSENNFEGFTQTEQFQGSRSYNRTLECITTMVPTSEQTCEQELSVDTTPNAENRGRSVHASYPKLLSLSRLDFLKDLYEKVHGEDVARRLCKAHRSSTCNQYEIGWKKFQIWLESNGHPDICNSTVLKFLEFIFSSNSYSPRTILSYRTALSLPLKLAFDIDFSAPEFSLLSRAQFNDRPPNARLIPQWCLDTVLKGLQSSDFDLVSCSQECLLMKCLFLTALASGNRVSEITAVPRHAVTWLNEGSRVVLAVKSGFIYKNQRMNRAPPNITFDECRDGEIIHPLCPIRALKTYLERTNEFTKGSKLFVNPQTGRDLNKGSIALWLCRTIQRFCPDSIPRAHDIRKMAASLAWVRGVDPSEIIASAFWARSDTFINRYLQANLRVSVPCVALGKR